MNIPDPMNIFKTGGDEHRFYEISNDARSFSSISDLFTDVFYVSYVENQGYLFYIRVLGYISYLLFDGNHVVLQMLGSSLFGCLIAVILFKLFYLYFNERKAYKYALLGFFLSPFFLYSIMLLRDIQVTFVFTLMTYIVLRPPHNRSLIWLALLVVVAFFLRMESGILSIVFPLIYIYRQSGRSYLSIAGIAIAVIGFVAYSEYSSRYIDIALSTNAHYQERSLEVSNSSLNKLPHPVREVSIFAVTNYFGPAAEWKEYKKVDGIYTFLNTTMRVVYKGSWLIFFILMFKWLFLDKRYKKLDKLLKWLFWIAIAIEFANTSQLETRRVMCIYPILFLVTIYLKEKIVNKADYIKDFEASFAYFVIISFLYTIM